MMGKRGRKIVVIVGLGCVGTVGLSPKARERNVIERITGLSTLGENTTAFSTYHV